MIRSSGSLKMNYLKYICFLLFVIDIVSSDENARIKSLSMTYNVLFESLTTKRHSYFYKQTPESVLKTHWDTFKKIYKKTYNSYEDKKRYDIFKENIKTITIHNIKYISYEVLYNMTINQYTDVDDASFHPLLCDDGHNKVSKAKTEKVYDFRIWSVITRYYPKKIKDYINYKSMGMIREHVHVQHKDCCSSYALATNAAMESQYALIRQLNYYVELSPQQILDGSCDKYGNKGCNGGSVEQAFAYLKNNSLTEEDTIPYIGVETGKPYDNSSPRVYLEYIVKVVGEDNLKKALNYAPVVGFVSVDRTMRFYGYGIYSKHHCSKETNHAVLIVGYGREYTIKGYKLYWLIQNFWGVEWGDFGTMKILRGTTECGIGKESFFPELL